MDMKSFADEMLKIFEKRAGRERILKAIGKRPLTSAGALLLAGGAAQHYGEKAKEDWERGRAYRLQMERSR